MARGESDKANSKSAALGLWSILAVIVLGVGFLIVSTMRDCSPPTPISPTTSQALRFEAAFTRVHDRDATNAWNAPHALHLHMARRGHVPLGAPSAYIELPLEITTSELEGACGVVVVVPDATSELVRIELGSVSLVPEMVPRFASVAVCGVERVEALGTGHAQTQLWAVPGLTPSDVQASGLGAEAAVAFAEAEALLRRDGWVATNRAIRVSFGRDEPAWELPRPSTGCTAWVLATSGFGTTSATLSSHRVGHDQRRGRQLLGAASCADGGEVSLQGISPSGGVLYALPFRHGGGPRMPGSVDAQLTSVADVRLTTRETLELPADP